MPAATLPRIAPNNGTGASFSAVTSFSFTKTIVDGDNGVVAVQINAGAANFISGISGGGGTGWQRQASTDTASSTFEVWYNEGMTGGSHTITVSFFSSRTGDYVAGFCPGLLASSSLDTTSPSIATTNSSSWTLAAGATATVAQDVGYVVCLNGFVGTSMGGSSSAPTGYTQLTSAGTSTGRKIYFDYKIRATAPGTENPSVTGGAAGASDVFNFCMVFKAVPNCIQERQAVAFSNSTTVTVVAPRAGNTQILAYIRANAAGASTVTQTGATWTRLGIATISGQCCEIWQCKNTSGSEGTTVTFGNAGYGWYFEEYGLDTSTPNDKIIDSTGANTSSTTTMTSGTTATPSQPVSLCLFAVNGSVNNVGGTWSAPTNGYATLKEQTVPNPMCHVGFKVIATAAAQSTAITLSPTGTGVNWATLLATFIQAGQSSPPTLQNNMFLCM